MPANALPIRPFRLSVSARRQSAGGPCPVGSAGWRLSSSGGSERWVRPNYPGVIGGTHLREAARGGRDRQTPGHRCPPKYWRHRGKLDVPKERFISYPNASPGSDKDSLLLGWAGWDHKDQATALITLIEDRGTTDGWDSARLTPLLADLQELIPGSTSGTTNDRPRPVLRRRLPDRPARTTQPTRRRPPCLAPPTE
jgi:hypothetical protein